MCVCVCVLHTELRLARAYACLMSQSPLHRCHHHQAAASQAVALQWCPCPAQRQPVQMDDSSSSSISTVKTAERRQHGCMHVLYSMPHASTRHAACDCDGDLLHMPRACRCWPQAHTHRHTACCFLRRRCYTHVMPPLFQLVANDLLVCAMIRNQPEPWAPESQLTHPVLQPRRGSDHQMWTGLVYTP